MTLEVVRFGTAKHWVDAGLYSLADLEKMVSDAKETEAWYDAAQKRSMEQVETIAAKVIDDTFNTEKKQ